jgi:UPF0716 protein FxsA
VLALLAVLFLLVPIAELAVIVRVSDTIGLGNTLLLLVVVSITGAWLVKREGLGVVRRVQERTARYEMPGDELLDGFLILLAGALMLTPGFLTDVVGLVFLVPPSRAVVRAFLRRRLRGRIEIHRYGPP